MRSQTCCFTGHRFLSNDLTDTIFERMNFLVNSLFTLGVTRFICGGALGFDQMAARFILYKRDAEGLPIRLIIAQPCRDQDAKWTPKQKAAYQSILQRADEVICLSEHYVNGCMQIRNRYMVDQSSYCICALSRPRGGTAQTVAYARKKGLAISNVLDDD